VIKPEADANQTLVPNYPDTFWGLVEVGARSMPDHVILADDYGRSLSTTQLLEASLGVASDLHARGIGPGSVVSWQLPTSIETMVTMAALSRLGAVQNPVIPLLRDGEVGFIVKEVATDFLIVPEVWSGFAHGDMARRLAAENDFEVLIADHETDPRLVGGGLRLPMGNSPDLPEPPLLAPRLTRWVFYSSGTTAEPKGVRHSDNSIMAGATGMISVVGATAADVNPLAFPISHIGGAAMLSTALLSGMRCALFDKFDAQAPERIAAHRPTLLGSAVPFFVAFMGAQIAHGGEPLFPALRACVGGGAPITAELGHEVRAVLGTKGIANAWGLTEFPVATFPFLDSTPEVLDYTAGPPVPGVDVRVVNERDEEVAPGQTGELRLKGPQCFLGYVHAELDGEAFDEDGWFRTGDLGFVGEDGNLQVTGRLKDIIIRNAENISALEVEQALISHPSVVDVAVVGVPDARVGERVGAVVVVDSGATVTVEELAAHCKALGIAAQKRPERVRLVGSLPRNSMGKVLKQQLRSEWEL
jgi:acyl-CoA synthetase (AMP-forming)/AMP-acid ligase II